MSQETDSNHFEVVYIDKFTDPGLFDLAQSNLQKLFGLKQRHLERLCCGRPVVIKKRISQQQAGRYRDAVVKAGGVAWVQEMGSDGSHHERRGPQRRTLFDRRAFYRVSVDVPDRRASHGRRTVDGSRNRMSL